MPVHTSTLYLPVIWKWYQPPSFPSNNPRALPFQLGSGRRAARKRAILPSTKRWPENTPLTFMSTPMEGASRNTPLKPSKKSRNMWWSKGKQAHQVQRNKKWSTLYPVCLSEKQTEDEDTPDELFTSATWVLRPHSNLYSDWGWELTQWISNKKKISYVGGYGGATMIVCTCARTHANDTAQRSWGGQKQLSLSPFKWVPRTDLRSSGLHCNCLYQQSPSYSF